MTTAPTIQRITLSIPDVMAATGLGRSRIYAELQSGRLESRRVGRRRVVAVDALERWLDNLPEG